MERILYTSRRVRAVSLLRINLLIFIFVYVLCVVWLWRVGLALILCCGSSKEDLSTRRLFIVFSVCVFYSLYRNRFYSFGAYLKKMKTSHGRFGLASSLFYFPSRARQKSIKHNIVFNSGRRDDNNDDRNQKCKKRRILYTYIYT